MGIARKNYKTLQFKFIYAMYIQKNVANSI